MAKTDPSLPRTVAECRRARLLRPPRPRPPRRRGRPQARPRPLALPARHPRPSRMTSPARLPSWGRAKTRARSPGRSPWWNHAARSPGRSSVTLWSAAGVSSTSAGAQQSRCQRSSRGCTWRSRRARRGSVATASSRR
ncbi:MAG: hypothetical protein GEU80_09860 [Dehalococcoidia bacterium]|nr:hypothetical protein [Dehalococcoidia bacterium]